jgi:hypothetical protein
MSHCKIIRLLYAALPVRAWRGYLVRNHLEVCPRCQAELASREEAASVLVQARDLAGSAALWPGIRRKLAEKEGEKTSRIAIGSVIRQYAAGAAALLVTVLASFWLLRDIKKPRVLSPQTGGDIRFEIKYIRVGGEAANAIIYQPQNSDAIFVWAGKNE